VAPAPETLLHSIGALAVSLQVAFAQAVKVVGELAATNVDRPYTDTVPHVFGRNAAGELIHYYWSPKPGWAVENLTARANIGTAFQFASDPVVELRLPDELHVFGHNAVGELIHYYWSPEPGWAAQNLTTTAPPVGP
jgi:hypothetical protein